MASVFCYHCKKDISTHFIKVGHNPYHPKCFLCKTCKKPISGSFNKNKGYFYHPNCFQKTFGLVCDHCKTPLGAQWNEYKKNKYHKSCLIKILPNKCDVCGDGILGDYIKDLWGNQAHANHPGPCSTCGRIISKRTSKGGYSYDDGRFICGYCKKTAISYSWSINKCKRQVLKKLDQVGFKKIPLNVPVTILDRQSLECKAGGNNVKGLAVSKQEFKNHKKYQLSHHIYTLYGLPKIEFMGIISHELIHVWQNEHDFKLSSMHSEGLCNLASYMIYSDDKSDLSLYLLNQLLKNKDPIYGNGFRLMLKRLEKLGWNKFIKEILTQKEGIEKSLWKKIFG